MIIIRPARKSDLDGLLEISHATGSGMSSMPSDLNSWATKIRKSEESFAKQSNAPEGEIYFMVMEDDQSEKIVGTTAIYAGVGLDQPFFPTKFQHSSPFQQALIKKTK
ncbi:MAG: arginine N-succinyltransferase [Sneathiella sp.]|nr:arginine N-succinyltransferase [Sneathiella sp.]